MMKKLFAVFLAVTMVVGMVDVPLSAAIEAAAADVVQFEDIPDDWSATALKNAAANGLLEGSNGKILPDEPLTRAQMAAIIVRAFGAVAKDDIQNYTDVKPASWYADDMAKAHKMGIMNGSNGKLYPAAYITRQEVFAIMARAFKLEPSDTINKTFRDADKISNWARGEIYAVVNGGYVQGDKGMLDPRGYITRAQFAVVFDKFVAQYFREAGEYSAVAEGNIMINQPDVTLKDVKIKGDLIIGDGVGDGNVTLDHVAVSGRVVVRGGGADSIRITGNSVVEHMIIDRGADGRIRVYAEDGAEVGEIIVDGEDDIIIEGRIGTLTVKTDDVTVAAAGAAIGSTTVGGENFTLKVDESSIMGKITVNAANSTITASAGSRIEDIIVNADGASIGGTGSVANVAANANHIAVNTPGTSVKAAVGTAGVTAGARAVSPGTASTVQIGGTSTGGGGGGPSGVAVDAVTVSPTAMTLAADTTGTITATVSPANAANKTVTWTSSDPDVATVANGTVTAGTAGTVTITAAAGGKTAACNVVVESSAADFTFNGDTKTITDYIGTGETVVIPSVIGGVKVMGIGLGAFRDCASLTSITLPNSVRVIEAGAFWGCSSLTDITIPDGVTGIGNEAFRGCSSLTAITVPGSVAVIGQSAFDGCADLISVIFQGPSNLTNIRDFTFRECSSLTSVTIPSSVTAIGEQAFNQCSDLISVIFQGPSNLASIGNSAFRNCSSLTSIVIPNNVTSIGTYAFSSCIGLTSASFQEPSQVSGIGESVFSGCTSLESIIIPGSVTAIGESAFGGCTGLASVTFQAQSNLADIGINAFSGCSSLTSIVIPGSVTAIGASAFDGCAGLQSINVDSSNAVYASNNGILYNQSKTTLITYPAGKPNASFTIPDSVTSIGDDAFKNCSSLTSITISGTVTTIGESVFNRCTALQSIDVDPSNTVYASDDNGVLYNKDKTALIAYPPGKTDTSFSIPDSVTSIGDFAFLACSSLASITIPDNVTIGWAAFSNCSSLASITIPDNVRIGFAAFLDCSSLTSITIGANVTIDSYMLSTSNNYFRDAYKAEGAGTYTGTMDGTWTKTGSI